MDLLRSSNNLRQIDRDAATCSCYPTVHKTRVMCVEFGSMHYRLVCSCSPTANLVKLGYFPSSPVSPTVAVDIKMLAFMDELHVRVSPNLSGWSAALETFLGQQGFHLGSNDSLRRKLGACLRWYRFTRATTNLVVDRFISFATPEIPPSSSEDPKGLDTPHVEHEPDAVEDEWTDGGGPTDLRASEYLQRACPACFGGKSCVDPELM
jgi:CxC1 like cysteine cluster associated with KDZ transposases